MNYLEVATLVREESKAKALQARKEAQGEYQAKFLKELKKDQALEDIKNLKEYLSREFDEVDNEVLKELKSLDSLLSTTYSI